MDAAAARKPVSGGIASSGWASSISRRRVVPERGEPKTIGIGAAALVRPLPTMLPNSRPNMAALPQKLPNSSIASPLQSRAGNAVRYNAVRARFGLRRGHGGESMDSQRGTKKLYLETVG